MSPPCRLPPNDSTLTNAPLWVIGAKLAEQEALSPKMKGMSTAIGTQQTRRSCSAEEPALYGIPSPAGGHHYAKCRPLRV